jgi:hypothetical protein
MVEIKPMDEGFLHLRCLHNGPIDARTFREKAGFEVTGSFSKRAWEFDEEDASIVQAQMAERRMTEREMWTWYRMVYEL